MIAQDNRSDNGVMRKEIYDYIVRYKAAHDGVPPSMREIGETMGIVLSVVFYHMRNLERDGLVKFVGHSRSRGIMVVGGKWVGPNG